MKREAEEFFETLKLQSKELQKRKGQTAKDQFLKRLGFSPEERRIFTFDKKTNQYL